MNCYMMPLKEFLEKATDHEKRLVLEIGVKMQENIGMKYEDMDLHVNKSGDNFSLIPVALNQHLKPVTDT